MSDILQMWQQRAWKAESEVTELEATIERVRGVRERILTELPQLAPCDTVHIDVAEWIQAAIKGDKP